MKATAIIVAAGSGKRFGGPVNKAFVKLKNAPVVAYSIRAFLKNKYIDEIIAVIRQEDEKAFLKILKYFKKENIKYVFGGKERQDSVLNGLYASSAENKKNIVLIHDAARPFVSQEIINDAFLKAKKYGAAVPVTPIKDTIKISSDKKTVKHTPKREELFLAQTPQAFRRELLFKALVKAKRNKFTVTDDAMAVEYLGRKVRLSLGSPANYKITFKPDLAAGRRR